MAKVAIEPCCLEREIALRLQDARRTVLRRALSEITRVKSLDKAQSIARDAVRIEYEMLRATDYAPVTVDRPGDGDDA